MQSYRCDDLSISMPQTMRHFVLTRFNVRSAANSTMPSDTWLHDRFELFERYCLPSLESQTEKNFSWVLFFDSQSPDWAREQVAAIQESSELNIRPVYVEGPFSGAVAAATLPGTAELGVSILTTRIDNDDCVASDFIASIQYVAANLTAPALINFVNGAQLHEGRIYRRPYRMNPFISFLESPNWVRTVRTVFVKGHDELEGLAPIHDIKTSEPMWLQVVHGTNIANEVVGLRTRGHGISDRFPIRISVAPRRAVIREGIRDALRIMLRLARKPARITQLVRVAASKRVPDRNHS